VKPNAKRIKTDLKQFEVQIGSTIRTAMQIMDKAGEGFICAHENNAFVGVVTDGDIRRAILRGINLGEKVETIINRNYIYLAEDSVTDEAVESIFYNTVAQQIPILQGNRLVDVIFEESFFLKRNGKSLPKKTIEAPVVIMAGGKGTRLEPFTRILPKPLIPIGEKPVIEIIMERFSEYGISKFFITLNHKEKMIKAFFEDLENPYDISFISEKEFLGTAGSLRLIEGKSSVPFIVTNCDVIVNADYSDIYKFHCEGGYALTLLGSMQHLVVPYGVCTLNEAGDLSKIEEKPEYDFLVNTGLYILNPDTLSLIGVNEHLDMNIFIERLQNKGEKIGVYPVSNASWVDVGQWEGYRKAIGTLTDSNKIFNSKLP